MTKFSGPHQANALLFVVCGTNRKFQHPIKAEFFPQKLSKNFPQRDIIQNSPKSHQIYGLLIEEIFSPTSLEMV